MIGFAFGFSTTGTGRRVPGNPGKMSPDRRLCIMKALRRMREAGGWPADRTCWSRGRCPGAPCPGGPRGGGSPVSGQLMPNPFRLRSSTGSKPPVLEKGIRTTPSIGARMPTDPLNS